MVNFSFVVGRRYRNPSPLGARGNVFRVTDIHGEPAVVKYISGKRESEVQYAKKYSGGIAPTLHGVERVEESIEMLLEAADGSLSDPRQLPPTTEGQHMLIFDVARHCLLLENDNTIHNDLNPNNIFVFRDPLPSYKLGDFGLTIQKCDYKRHVLHVDGICGTPGYIAPESFSSSSSYSNPDIFAFGMCLYYFGEGRQPNSLFLSPFFLKKPDVYFLSMSKGNYFRPLVRTPPRFLDKPFQPLFYACIEPDPRNRPKSFKEIVSYLRTIP